MRWICGTHCTSYLDWTDLGRPFLCVILFLPRILQYRSFLQRPSGSPSIWSIFILCLMYKWNGLHLFYSAWHAESHPVILCEFGTSVMDINEGNVLRDLSCRKNCLYWTSTSHWNKLMVYCPIIFIKCWQWKIIIPVDRLMQRRSSELS